MLPKSKPSFLEENFPHIVGKNSPKKSVTIVDVHVPPPDKIDAALRSKAEEVDKIASKVGDDEEEVIEESVVESALPEPRILRLLVKFGPPEEWTQSDRMTIGEENATAMEKAWEAMDPVEQDKVREKFEASKKGGMNEEMKPTGMMPLGAEVTIK